MTWHRYAHGAISQNLIFFSRVSTIFCTMIVSMQQGLFCHKSQSYLQHFPHTIATFLLYATGTAFTHSTEIFLSKKKYSQGIPVNILFTVSSSNGTSFWSLDYSCVNISDMILQHKSVTSKSSYINLKGKRLRIQASKKPKGFNLW